jgi:hypothetical protein
MTTSTPPAKSAKPLPHRLGSISGAVGVALAVPANVSRSRLHDPNNGRAFRKKVVISKSPFWAARRSLPARPSDLTNAMALSARRRYFGDSWFIAGSMMEVARSIAERTCRPVILSATWKRWVKFLTSYLYVQHGRVGVAEITNTSRRARPSTRQA